MNILYNIDWTLHTLIGLNFAVVLYIICYFGGSVVAWVANGKKESFS